MDRHSDSTGHGMKPSTQDAAYSRQALHNWYRGFPAAQMQAMGFSSYLQSAQAGQQSGIPYVHSMPAYHHPTQLSQKNSVSALQTMQQQYQQRQHMASASHTTAQYPSDPRHQSSTSTNRVPHNYYSSKQQTHRTQPAPSRSFSDKSPSDRTVHHRSSAHERVLPEKTAPHPLMASSRAASREVPPPLDLSGSKPAPKRSWAGADERPLDLSMKKQRIDDDIVVVDHIKAPTDKYKQRARGPWSPPQQSSNRTKETANSKETARDNSHWNTLCTTSPNRNNNHKALLANQAHAPNRLSPHADRHTFFRNPAETNTKVNAQTMQNNDFREASRPNQFYSMVGEGLKAVENSGKPKDQCSIADKFRDPSNYFKMNSWYGDHHKWQGDGFPRPHQSPAHSKAAAAPASCGQLEAPSMPSSQPPPSSSSPSLAHFGKKKYLLEQVNRENSPVGQNPVSSSPPSWKVEKAPETLTKEESLSSETASKEGEGDAMGLSPYRSVDSHHFSERRNKIIPVANVQPMRKLSDDVQKADEAEHATPAETNKDSDVSKLFNPATVHSQQIDSPLSLTVAHAATSSNPPDVFNKTDDADRKDLSLHFATPKGRHKLLFQKTDDQDEEKSESTNEEEQEGKSGKESEEDKAKTSNAPSDPPVRTKRKYVRRKKPEAGEKKQEAKPKRKYVRRKPLPEKKKPGSTKKTSPVVKEIDAKKETDEEENKESKESKEESPSTSKQDKRAENVTLRRRTRRGRNSSQSRIRAALRSARNSFNKNAAYEDELHRDEQRSLLKKSRAPRSAATDREDGQNEKAASSSVTDNPGESDESPVRAKPKKPLKKKVIRKRHGLKLSDLAVIGRKRRYNLHRRRGAAKPDNSTATASSNTELTSENADQTLLDGGSQDADAKRLFVCKETGESMLHKAARRGYEDVAECCLAVKGYDPNIRDNAGYTPLHECSVAGNLLIGLTLLTYGADANAKALDGTRPIHDAVDNDRLEMTRLLLSQGADPHISNYSGRTPVKLARSTAMKSFIQGHFSDVNVHSDEIHPWQFQPNYSAKGPVGFDVLHGAPVDAEEKEIEFDFFDEEPIPLFYLQVGNQIGPRNYHLLSDVATCKKTSPMAFTAKHKELKYVQVHEEEWKKVTEGRIKDSFGPVALETASEEDIEPVDQPDTKVTLVEFDSKLRDVLGVVPETLTTCTPIRNSTNMKDLIKLKHKLKATKIDGTEKKGETGSLENLLKTPVIQRCNMYSDQIKKPCSVTLFDIKHKLKVNGRAEKEPMKRRGSKMTPCRKGLKSDKNIDAMLANAIKSLKNLCLDQAAHPVPLPKKKASLRGRKNMKSSVLKNHLNGIIMKGAVQALLTKTFKKRKRGTVLAESAFQKKLSKIPSVPSEGEKKKGASVADLPVLEKQDTTEEEASSDEREVKPVAASSVKEREMPELTPM